MPRAVRSRSRREYFVQMTATIEERLTSLYDSVRGSSEVPWEVYRRVQFFARVMRGAPPGAGGEAFLLWLDSQGEIASLAVPGAGAVIGREAGGDVVLANRRVSRRHCAVRWTAGDVRALEVEDLGSSNGTCVNGVPLPARGRRTLRDGDVIEIGGVALAVAMMDAG